MIRRVNSVISRFVARKALKVCGKNFRLGYSSHIKGYRNISIGNNFFSGPYLYLNTNNISEICIGHDVMLGPYVKIISGNHILHYRYGPMNSAPPKVRGDDKGIVINNDVWIGAGVTILDGAHISEGAVIGAGSVVSKYIPPYVIAAGNSVRVIKPRFSFSDLSVLLEAKRSTLTVEEIKEQYIKYGVVNG